MYEKKFLTISRSIFTIRVYFAFSMPCQKYVFDNLGGRFPRKLPMDYEFQSACN